MTAEGEAEALAELAYESNEREKRLEARVAELEGDVLTPEEASVLLSGVVGWDEAELDRKEKLHDEAMAKLRRRAGEATDDG